jgi:hypothetical protein
MTKKKSKQSPPRSLLERMGFERVPATDMRKLVRLGIVREPGWVYLPHSKELKILRRPHDPNARALSYDDEAELVQAFEADVDRERVVLIVDADGDIAAVDRGLGLMFTMDADGAFFSRASHPAAKEPRVPLDPEHVRMVLDDLNEIAPDTVDEGKFGPWTFDAIEKTKTHWLVGFENSTGSDIVAFKSKHPLANDNKSSQKWTDDLMDAIREWEEGREGYGD